MPDSEVPSPFRFTLGTLFLLILFASLAASSLANLNGIWVLYWWGVRLASLIVAIVLLVARATRYQAFFLTYALVLWATFWMSGSEDVTRMWEMREYLLRRDPLLPWMLILGQMILAAVAGAAAQQLAHRVALQRNSD